MIFIYFIRLASYLNKKSNISKSGIFHLLLTHYFIDLILLVYFTLFHLKEHSIILFI